MDKEFDFSTAKRANQVPALQQLRQAYQHSEQAKVLDDDVLAWACIQDQNTKRHINEMIRNVMAIQQRQAMS